MFRESDRLAMGSLAKSEEKTNSTTPTRLTKRRSHLGHRGERSRIRCRRFAIAHQYIDLGETPCLISPMGGSYRSSWGDPGL